MWNLQTDAEAMIFIRSCILISTNDADVTQIDGYDINNFLHAEGIHQLFNEINELTINIVLDRHVNRLLNKAVIKIDRNLDLRKYLNPRRYDIDSCAIEIKDILCNLYKENKIPKGQLEWINVENPRACMFVFSALIEPEYQQNCLIDQYLTEQYDWENLDLEKSPSNIIGMKKEIEKFFNVWGVSAENKSTLLHKLKENYYETCKYHRPEEWLSNNSDLVQWAWTYVKNKHYNDVCPLWYEIHANSKLTKHVIISTFDLILNKKERDYLMLQMSKHGAQQKYRAKAGNDKPVQVTIRKSIKDMLVKKSQIEGIPYKQLLEKIISDSCS